MGWRLPPQSSLQIELAMQKVWPSDFSAAKALREPPLTEERAVHLQQIMNTSTSDIEKEGLTLRLGKSRLDTGEFPPIPVAKVVGLYCKPLHLLLTPIQLEHRSYTVPCFFALEPFGRLRVQTSGPNVLPYLRAWFPKFFKVRWQ